MSTGNDLQEGIEALRVRTRMSKIDHGFVEGNGPPGRNLEEFVDNASGITEHLSLRQMLIINFNKLVENKSVVWSSKSRQPQEGIW
jgi:hypothetical protein